MLKNIQKIFWMLIFYPLVSKTQKPKPKLIFSKTRKLFIFLLTLTSLTYSQWQQSQFIIGANLNPELTYTNESTDQSRITTAKNAGINLLVVPNWTETNGFTTTGVNWTLNRCTQLGMLYLGTNSRHMKQGGWNVLVQVKSDFSKNIVSVTGC